MKVKSDTSIEENAKASYHDLILRVKQMAESLLSDVISALDRAALDPIEWPGSLDLIASLFKSHTALIYFQDQTCGTYLIGNRKLVRCHKCSALAQFISCSYCEAKQLDLCRIAFATLPGNEIRTGSGHFPDALRWGQTSTTEDPLELDHALGCQIIGERSLSVKLIMLRHNHVHGFHRLDIDCLKGLLSQLQRTVRTHCRLFLLIKQRDESKNVLNQLFMGVIMLDSQGQITFCNSRAEQILETGKGLSRDIQGQCVAAQPREALLLQKAIRVALSSDGTTAVEEWLKISRPGNKKPYSVMVLPEYANESDSIFRKSSAVIFIGDPEHEISLPVTQLAKLYGLTPSEARLCTVLAQGYSLKEAAKIRQLSESTVRQYLKRVFRKTHCHRQSELVRLLLTMPINLKYQRRSE